MANEVEILDAIMGSNKTNGIIKWMDNHPNEKYIYISPLLSEVTYGSRLDTDVKNIKFEFPSVNIVYKTFSLRPIDITTRITMWFYQHNI